MGVFLMWFSRTHLCPGVNLGLPVTVDLIHSLNMSFRKDWVFFALSIVIGSVYHQVEDIIVVTPVLQRCAIPSLSRTYCICHATAVRCLFFSLPRILPSFWQKLQDCSHPACLVPKGNGKQDSLVSEIKKIQREMLVGRSELSNNLAKVLTIPMKSIWFVFCECLQKYSAFKFFQPSVVYLTRYRSSDLHERQTLQWK